MMSDISNLKELLKTRNPDGSVIEISEEFIASLDFPKDEDGYYLDAHGNQIHFKGIPELKAPNTKLNITNDHLLELYKCSEDYEYFYKNYVRVLTAKGYRKAENRKYQEELSGLLTSEKRLLVMQPRQSGKCCTADTKINIRNKVTGEVISITMEEFHEMQKS